MGFKTIEYVVGLVQGLLGAITVPKYSFSRPADCKDSEYIVINSLPIDADVMQTCHVNVNYHVKDFKPGVPDIVSLQNGVESIMAILTKVSTTTYLIDFESSEVIQESQLGEHYSNLRFVVKYINT